jgi:hypothetical protein
MTPKTETPALVTRAQEAIRPGGNRSKRSGLQGFGKTMAE